MRLIVGFALVTSMIGSHISLAQFGDGYLSPTERLLMMQLSTRQYTDRQLMQQIYALQVRDQNRAMVQNPQGMPQFRNRQQVGSFLRSGSTINGLRAPVGRGTTGSLGAIKPRRSGPPIDLDLGDDEPAERSDFLVVWEELGASFHEAKPEQLTAVTDKFSAGMQVVALRVDGPAVKAGWKSGDILVGLLRYKTKSYSDIAYVCDLDGVKQQGPIRSILIRDGKLVDQTIDFKFAKPITVSQSEADPLGDVNTLVEKPSDDRPESADVLVADTSRKKLSNPLLPTRRVTSESGASTPETSVPVSPSTESDVHLVWERYGARVEIEQFEKRSRIKITEVRPDSVVDKAGWRVNDEIVSIDVYRITSIGDLAYVAESAEIGTYSPYSFLIRRDGKPFAGRVLLKR